MNENNDALIKIGVSLDTSKLTEELKNLLNNMKSTIENSLGDVLSKMREIDSALSSVASNQEKILKHVNQEIVKSNSKVLKEVKATCDKMTTEYSKVNKAKQQAFTGNYHPKVTPVDFIANVSNDKALKTFTLTFERVITGALYKVGNSLTSAFYKGFTDTLDKDFSIKQAIIKSTTDTYKPNYSEYSKIADKIGSSTRFTNAQVAQAMQQGSALGLSNNLLPVTQVSAQLGQAINSNIESAMEKTVMITNAFNLKTSEEITTAMDKVLYATNRSSMDMERLSSGMSQVGAKAKSAGITLDTTLAVLGQLNNIGITGGKAGTSFQSFITNITQASKREKLETVMHGESIKDKNGNIDIIKILEKLNESVKKGNLDNADKLTLFTDLFGIRASKVVDSLVNDESIAELKKLINGIEKAKGTVKNQNDFIMDSMAGSFYNMKSAIETFFTVIQSSLRPLIMPLFKLITIIFSIMSAVLTKFPGIVDILGVLLLRIAKIFVIAKLTQMFNSIKGILKSILTLKGVLFNLGVFLISNMLDQIYKNEELLAKWQNIKRTVKEIGWTLLKIIARVLSLITGIPINAELFDISTVSGTKTILETIERIIGSIKRAVARIDEFIKEHPKLLKVILRLITGLAILSAVVKLFQVINTLVLVLKGLLIAINGITLIWKTLLISISVVLKVLTFGLTTIKFLLYGITTIISGAVSILGAPLVIVIGVIIGLVAIVWWQWERVKKIVVYIKDKLISLIEIIKEIGIKIAEFLISPFKRAYEWLEKIVKKGVKKQKIRLDINEKGEYGVVDETKKLSSQVDKVQNQRLEILTTSSNKTVAVNGGINISINESTSPRETSNELLRQLATIGIT